MIAQATSNEKKPTLSGSVPGRRRIDPLALAAFVLAVAALVLAWKPWIAVGGARKVAFVDTQRLMTGFKEAHKVNKELEAEDGKWKADLKAMEDSLKAFMDTMTVKFDAADVKTKKQMQDELAMRNQQVNNFQRYHTKKMQDLTQQKMQDVYAKINAFMKEFGASRGYDIIFGTVSGSILYGESTPADITNEVLEQLAKRYE